MNQYEKFMEHVYKNGTMKTDRTGTGTKSVFGYQMRFDLNEGFPLVTTKKVHTKSIIVELLWFLSGSTNVKYLQDNGVRIWNDWCDENGDLGPIYGKQWRNFGGVDQIADVIKSIKTNPDSRRHIVSAWNVAEVSEMALPPCHVMFQFYVNQGKLSCQLYQRSADVLLGLPFNIASYALLTHMIAQQCNLGVGEFIWTGGDCHIYTNHFKQVELQLSRESYPFPKLEILRVPESIDDYQLEDFSFINYQHHDVIKAPVAV